MTVDYFLIDGPHVVPAEFGAWVAAKERHAEIFRACIDAAEGSQERAGLDRAGLAAKAVADDLEQAARAAWRNATLKARPGL